jgi:hypothetical protein
MRPYSRLNLHWNVGKSAHCVHILELFCSLACTFVQYFDAHPHIRTPAWIVGVEVVANHR